MTIDEERFRAIENVRMFLRDLMRIKSPVKVKELREKAYRRLKHYPEEWFMKKLKEKYYL